METILSMTNSTPSRFRLSTDQVTSVATITDYIVSEDSRASHITRIYSAVTKGLGTVGQYQPLEIPLFNGIPDYAAFANYMREIKQNPFIRSLVILDSYTRLAFLACDANDERAKICQAVNLIVREGANLIGYNIDGEAFLLGACAALGSFAPKNAGFFGCGATSTAIATAIAGKLEAVTLIEVDPARGEKLRSTLTELNPELRCELLMRPAAADLSGCDFLYNGTGLGKTSNNTSSVTRTPLVSGDRLPQDALAIDITYVPSTTSFLKALEANGNHALNGFSHMIGRVALHLSKVHERDINIGNVVMTALRTGAWNNS